MKKLFLLLTAMLLSTGMWATESETFPTSRFFHASNLNEIEQCDALWNDYGVQSQKYAKIELKDVATPSSWFVLKPVRTDDDVYHDHSDDYYQWDYQFWLRTSQVEVTLLDEHAHIDSITVSYATDISNSVSISFKKRTFSMKFPEGETSHLFTFVQGALYLNSITVNYHLTAVDNVPYIDEAGNAQTQDNVNVIYSSPEQTTLDAGWYVVTGENVQTGTLICNGAVHLILADGAKLTATGRNLCAGIQVSGTGNSLTIYGQTGQSGQLIATGGTAGAGIGGGSSSSGSNITINGGVITANGGYHGAGIGGGRDGDGTNITINGGVVTTTGGDLGASIGEGRGGHTAYITFNGGKVWISGNRAFGNDNPRISNIYVDGSLLLKGGSTNPPTNIIGHSTGDDVTNHVRGFSYVTIEPVEPMTVSFDKQGGEGGSDDVIVTYQAPMPQITIPARGEDVFLGYFSEVNGQGTKYYNADGTSAHDWDQIEANTLYAKWKVKVAVSYIDEDGTQKIKDAHSYTEITNSTVQETWTAGWYAVLGEVNLAKGAICNGDVHLILADGAKLTATGDVLQAGIRVTGSGNSLTIYGQTAQSGQLIANGGNSAAGIGGDKNNPTGEHITICGGKIIATGGNNGAGIGGGRLGSGTDITIRNGEVITNGGDCAAAIGSGYAYLNSESFNAAGATNITVLGGKVVATGADLGAGIGGGWRGYASNIIISGGDVTAIGGRNAAGIGAGNDNQGHHIYINGGTITATSGENASAIGNGNNASYGFAHHDIYVNTSVVVKAGDSPDPNDVIDNLTSTEIAGKIKRKRYVTIEPGAIIVTRYAENMDANYGTYYNGTHAYEVQTEGVTLYTASLATYGDETYLDLSEIEGNILPAGTPVIVRSETETDVLMIEHYGPTADIILPANSLSGTSESTTVASNTVYTLSAENIDGVNTLGFYIFAGTTIPAHKAYLQLEPGQSAPRRICFGTSSVGTATGIQNANANANANKYIRDGQLYIEREGRIYNVQGAIVK